MLQSRTMTGATIVLAASLLIAAWPGAAAADGWLASADWRRWPLGDTQEFGRAADDRPSELGGGAGGDSSRLSGRRLKAGGLSLLVPGLGQFYNGQKTKGLVMVGLEAAIWGAFAGFHQHAGTLEGDSETWAEIYAGIAPGRAEDLYQALGRYEDSDAWYESRLRDARAFGEPTPEPPTEDQRWEWRSEQYRRDYLQLRADTNQAYDRRDMMILFAVVNRALSVFDAVRSGDRDHDDPAVGGRVLGTDVSVAVSAPMAVPAARVTAGWSF